MSALSTSEIRKNLLKDVLKDLLFDISKDVKFYERKIDGEPKGYFITELSSNSYSVLNPIENFTRTIQSMELILKEIYEFLRYKTVPVNIDIRMIDVSDVDLVEKLFSEKFISFNKRLVNIVESLSYKPENVIHRFSNCLAGDYLLFNFKGKNESDNIMNMNINIKQLYESLRIKTTANNVNNII
jgi:hypothetical protein